MKTAIVIGGTGLVGAQLVDLLLNDQDFEKIKVFGRRSLNISNSKLEEHLINFSKPEDWSDAAKGVVLFSCIRATVSKAERKEKNEYSGI